MKTYNQFLDFLIKNYRNFIFVVVFYSLWLSYKYILAFDPQLLSFQGRMIGQATLNAYDINLRISTFYKSGLIFFLSIAFLSFVSWRIHLFSQHFTKSAEVQMLNYTSLAGITFYFFNLWTHSFSSSYELIYCIHKVAISGLIIKWLIVKNQPVAQFINATFYSISFVLGVSVFFLLNEISVLFQLFPKLDFLVTIYIAVLIIAILTIIYVKEKSSSETTSFLNRTAFFLIPIACIPVLSFLKDEVYLVLNRHEVYYFSPRKLYILFVFVLAGISFWRYKHFQKQVGIIAKTNIQLLTTRYFPLLVISLSTYTFYSPFIPLSDEMFEAGNQLLPLMELQKFGVIPIFEKFNSHLLSEIFFGGIYMFFNGLHSREIYIYEFIYEVFWAFMVYSFVLKLSRNAYIALFVILLFPLIDTLITNYTIISLLAIFIINKITHEKASFKNYFLFVFCIAFLLLWRADIGYPSLIAACFTLLVYWINWKKFSISWKLLLKVLTIFIGHVFIGLLLIGWHRHINVFEKLRSGINYLASAQTYGYITLGDNTQSLYKIQYFFFPTIVILGLGSMLVFFKKLNVSKSQRFIYSSFIFLIIYYFVNFQRGLVRHSLYEGIDDFLSAFIFFILSGGVFLFCQNRSKVFRLIAFIVIASFLMMNYKLPAPKEFRNLYSKTKEKINVFSAIEPRPNIARCIDTAHYEETLYSDFRKLVPKYLNEKQTFIDFSNLPMLYYLTGKISPSYFYQNPLTIHNDYLQNKFIAELPAYDAPLLVFSNFPKNWWDNVDGVPNTIRHYKLAEYFYAHYTPFVITNELCIWKKKDFVAENKQHTLFSYSIESDSSKIISNSLNCSIQNLIKKKYLLKIEFNNNAPAIAIDSKRGRNLVNADFINDKNHTAYYILKEADNNDFSIDFSKNDNIRSVVVTENDFIPDFYSEYPQREDLKQLPYIWANYDDSIKTEKVLQNLSPLSVSLVQNDIQYFSFSPTIDKTSGNTILISLETNNEDPLSIDLVFGNNKSNFKGDFGFIIPPGTGTRDYAIRVSSNYNWYDSSINYIGLISNQNKSITVKRIELLKAK
jgi:nitrogen regulatory protein PII-like uncharacterized protein